MTESTAPLIVLVEDEEHLAQGLLFNLQAEGYRTHHEADGDAALAYLLAPGEDIAAIVLDCMLPGADGFTIVRALRDASTTLPSSCSPPAPGPKTSSKASKPAPTTTSPSPSTSTSSSFASNPSSAAPPGKPPPAPGTPPPATSGQTAEYSFNHRTIRFDELELIAPNRTTHLTLMEADLLRYFTEREGQIVSRKQILEEVWRVHEDTDTRAIDNFIVRLRRYIEDDPSDPQHLVTVRGIGYRFIANP